MKNGDPERLRREKKKNIEKTFSRSTGSKRGRGGGGGGGGPLAGGGTGLPPCLFGASDISAFSFCLTLNANRYSLVSTRTWNSLTEGILFQP